MVPSKRSVLTTCIALVVVGIEARKTQRSGPTVAPPDRHRTATFSFAAMSVFLVLSACAEAPAPEPRAALPAQRNLASAAPTPCTISNSSQTEKPNVLNSPQPSDIDRLNMDCLQGVPPPWTAWSGPTREPSPGNVLGRTEAKPRYWYWEAPRFREEVGPFERNQRSGR